RSGARGGREADRGPGRVAGCAARRGRAGSLVRDRPGRGVGARGRRAGGAGRAVPPRNVAGATRAARGAVRAGGRRRLVGRAGRGRGGAVGVARPPLAASRSERDAASGGPTCPLTLPPPIGYNTSRTLPVSPRDRKDPA